MPLECRSWPGPQVLWLSLALGGGAAALAAPSPQSVEVLSRRCTSELGQRDVTLFANGTLRERERFEEEISLRLVELGPEEVASFVARLRAIDLEEVDSVRGGVGGEWVGQCSITLNLGSGAPDFFRYGDLDTLPLGLERLRGVLAELEALIDERSSRRGLPSSYEPRPGDLLVQEDGSVFEVVGLTADGRGVELAGIDQPVTLYVALEEFRQLFVDRVGTSLLELDR